MQYILINTKTLEEHAVEIPDRDDTKPEDYQVLVGEKVYALSPLTSSEVLDYRHTLKEIISLGFNELIPKYPVKKPEDITEEFKAAIAKEFDTVVETRIPDKKAVYMKHHDAAVRELTITFLNGATAWTKYRDTVEYIKRHMTANDYATDYTNQLLETFNPDKLADETAKTFLPKLEQLADCMKYDERTHLVYGEFTDALDSLVTILEKDVVPHAADVKLTKAAYEKECPAYAFILNSLFALHELAVTNQRTIATTEQVVNQYQADPSVTYLIAAKAVVYQFINDTDKYLRDISGDGTDTMKATYMAEYKKKIEMFFNRYEFLLAAEARDTRKKDEEIAKKSRTTMYAIRATMYNVRNSKDEEWYKTLAIHFLQNKFELFKDVMSEEEMKEYLRWKMDQTHPLPKKDGTDQPEG